MSLLLIQRLLAASLILPGWVIVEGRFAARHESLARAEQVSNALPPAISPSSSIEQQDVALEFASSPTAQQRVVATGIPWLPRTRTGEATVPLEVAGDPKIAEFYPYALIYRVGVNVGDRLQHLVVDTGASNSVFSEQIAQEMGLPSTPVMEQAESLVVGDQCPDLTLRQYALPPLSVGEASVSGVAAVGLPFQTNPTNTEGVLGMDFLSMFDLVVDPQTRQLQLQAPSPPVANAVPLQGRSGLMAADVTIRGQGPFPFMLDTGAALTVISPRLAERLNLDLNQAQPIQVIGFCGTEDGHYLRLSSVAMGEHDIDIVDVIVLDSPVLNALQVDGIIGQNVLNRFRQHWQFGEADEQGFPATGSLELSPVNAF